MSFNSAHDRWLLPRHQTEYPARALLPEATLHGRREATYLVLAAWFFVGATAMLVLGTSRVFDLVSVIGFVVPGVEIPNAMLVPLGALPFALTVIASSLACELFGSRRASMLIWVGLVMSVALAGLMRLADLIDGGDAFGVGLAFAACFVLAHATNLIAFDALRVRASGHQMYARIGASALLATAIGWCAFAFVLHAGGGYIVEPLAWETILALSIGAAVCTAVAVLVLAIFAVLARRALVVALRVGPDGHTVDDDDGDRVAVEPDEPTWARPPQLAVGSTARRLPRAELVDDTEEIDEPSPRHGRAASSPPYSSAEMRFFAEGDEA
jgi:uncharacterized PurR-regulated membrane protein YhhQ (DUF165 family)